MRRCGAPGWRLAPRVLLFSCNSTAQERSRPIAAPRLFLHLGLLATRRATADSASSVAYVKQRAAWRAHLPHSLSRHSPTGERTATSASPMTCARLRQPPRRAAEAAGRALRHLIPGCARARGVDRQLFLHHASPPATGHFSRSYFPILIFAMAAGSGSPRRPTRRQELLRRRRLVAGRADEPPRQGAQHYVQTRASAGALATVPPTSPPNSTAVIAHVDEYPKVAGLPAARGRRLLLCGHPRQRLRASLKLHEQQAGGFLYHVWSPTSASAARSCSLSIRAAPKAPSRPARVMLAPMVTCCNRGLREARPLLYCRPWDLDTGAPQPVAVL